MLRDASEVDDLVQRVFLEFLSSLGRYRGDASLRTWLHRIARNVALNDVRSRRRQKAYVRAYAETVETERGETPEREILARERLELVKAVLSGLSESFSEVWVLRELQGFSAEETAQILEIPAATVRTRHHRARQRIFECLQDLDRGGAVPSDHKLQLRVLPGEGGDS